MLSSLVQLNGQFVAGWSDFLVMIAYYGPTVELKIQLKISHDVLDTLIDRAKTGHHPRLLNKLAELHWMLLQGWKSDTQENPRVLASLGQLLMVIAERDLTSYPARFQAAVLTSAISTVRLLPKTSCSSETLQLLDHWIRPAALCAQSCLLQLPRLLQVSDFSNSNLLLLVFFINISYLTYVYIYCILGLI